MVLINGSKTWPYSVNNLDIKSPHFKENGVLIEVLVSNFDTWEDSGCRNKWVAFSYGLQVLHYREKCHVWDWGSVYSSSFLHAFHHVGSLVVLSPPYHSFHPHWSYWTYWSKQMRGVIVLSHSFLRKLRKSTFPKMLN